MQQVLPSCGLQFAIPLRLWQYRLIASGGALSVQDCAEAEAGTGSKFFQAGVGSFDPNAASAVRYGAEVLKAASERQASLVANCQ